jgi:hypothetical protein
MVAEPLIVRRIEAARHAYIDRGGFCPTASRKFPPPNRPECGEHQAGSMDVTMAVTAWVAMVAVHSVVTSSLLVTVSVPAEMLTLFRRDIRA